MRSSDCHQAARLLQRAYREHIVTRAVVKYARLVAARDAQLAAETGKAAAIEAAKLQMILKTNSQSPWQRVWPFAKEAMCIMLLAAMMSLAPAPPSPSGLPDVFIVRPLDAASLQLRAALLGALCIVAMLLAVVLVLLALLARGWQRTVSTVFTLIIGLLLCLPVALLLRLGHETGRLPIDGLLLITVSWAAALPVLMQAVLPLWAAKHACTLHRLHVAAAAAMLAWLFSDIPWQTFVATAILVVMLDGICVLMPCSPIRKLFYQSSFSTFMPTFTFEANGLELIICDFFAFALLAIYAISLGLSMLTAAVLGTSLGVGLTMHIIASTYPTATCVCPCACCSARRSRSPFRLQ